MSERDKLFRALRYLVYYILGISAFWFLVSAILAAGR